MQTLGCPKNEADSRSLCRALWAAGVQTTEDPARATHFLLNTCGFIQDAKEESIAAILEACAAYPLKPVLVMGCLVERYREELAAGIPEVAAWFGLAVGPEREGLLRALGAAEGGREDRGPKGGGRARDGRDPAVASVARLQTPHAYVKISDGCDELCTFCAIPAIKGPYQSLRTEEVLEQADACLAEGARELVLVGQDTARWRSGGTDLAGLIDLLAKDERVRWIRVMYLQPEHVTNGFLRYMAAQPKLCRYLDVPFQHSHPAVLRRMGRAGDGRSYLDLLAAARRSMPDVAVRSAFIVGFPGETAAQFRHLLDFVRAGGFDYAGGFIYSPEEGTPAERLRPRVGRTVALERLNRLNAVLAETAEAAHQHLVGTRAEVIIEVVQPEEGGEGVAAIGRTRGQAPEVDGVTYLEGRLPDGAGVGDVVEMTVEAAVGYDLVGTCDVP